MPTTPLVSVIVPVYNAEQYLRYCVSSILNQSYTNLEVILVDDGSSDTSPALCDQYAATDARVVAIHQPNGGIGAAQNAGLDAAHGKYIAFADNDDILDKRNIELLLHALESTGADMSKARWQQFGISQIDTTAVQAAIGATPPDSVTVFREPLCAYQTVFCKSMRVLGDLCRRRTEARYFNEANWCRLYRRELWDGLRFPEGMYAQDVMVAGNLYARMEKVTDVNRVLYYWLQSNGSVTHSERSFDFYHDNFAAGAANFRLCLEHNIVPMRSFYTIAGALTEENNSISAISQTDAAQHKEDTAIYRELISHISPCNILRCQTARFIRLAEKHVYDHKIKNMQ